LSTPDKTTIHAWLIRYIQRQRFVDSLEWIAEQIKLDVIDEHEYTKHSDMQSVRNAWAEQIKHAKQEE
jgi:hypothetical protein